VLNIFSKNKLGFEQFPALTGIRAVAAFMVFFHHLPLNLEPGFLIGLQLSFYTGVTLFFVLSGFLITHRYYGKIELSRKYAWNYLVNRFSRIYPLYFLVLTIVVFVMKNFDPVFLLQNYTLTHNLFFIFPSHGLAINPSWSLTVEECFYLLAPFIFFLNKKYNLWLPFSLTLLLLLLILFTYNNSTPFSHRIFETMTGSFFGHCISFFCGIYLALTLMKKQKNKVHSKKASFTIAGIIGIAIVFIPLIYVTNKENAARYAVMIVCNNLILPLPVAVFYYGLISENSWCRQFLSFNMMRLFGRSSYAFYLIHLPLIDYVATPFIKPYFNGNHYDLYVLVIFILTLLISIITFIFFEHPMNLLIRKKLRRT